MTKKNLLTHISTEKRKRFSQIQSLTKALRELEAVQYFNSEYTINKKPSSTVLSEINTIKLNIFEIAYYIRTLEIIEQIK